MKKNKISNITGILFIIWFIASIIGILLSDKESYTIFIIIGQYLLIASILGIYSIKEPMLSIHYFAGLLLLSMGLIGRNFDRLSILISDLSINQILFIGLLIISLISIIVSLIIFLKEKKSKKLFYPFLISDIIFVVGLIIITIY